MTPDDLSHLPTPGPWNLKTTHGEHAPFFSIDAGGGNWPTGFHIAGIVDKADARLIAAAPDLLRALEMAAATVDVLMTWAPKEMPPLTAQCARDHLARARATIAKARGEV